MVRLLRVNYVKDVEGLKEIARQARSVGKGVVWKDEYSIQVWDKGRVVSTVRVRQKQPISQKKNVVREVEA